MKPPWKHFWLVVLVLSSPASGCLFAADPAPPDWQAWQAKRLESVAGTNGWTTLVGRHWLTEGRHCAGTDPTNEVRLPEGRAEPVVGSFIRAGRAVRFEAAPGVVATVDGKGVSATELQSDRDGHPTKLQMGPLTFVVIERGERLGLRVRDPEAPSRLGFHGLTRFPYDPSWRIEGRFEAFPAPRVLRVPDILGGTQEFPSPGALVFHRDGTEYRLDVAEEPDEEDYFVMFRDQTAGEVTYPSGRFLYVARSDAEGKVVIDFNCAYTPPCGFTPFATCPLPPRQNWLPLPVRAGELKPADHP